MKGKEKRRGKGKEKEKGKEKVWKRGRERGKKGEGEGEGKGKMEGIWLKKRRSHGRTHGRTNTQMILYSVQCYALHWTDKNRFNAEPPIFFGGGLSLGQGLDRGVKFRCGLLA